jgi:hypothetical protein
MQFFGPIPAHEREEEKVMPTTQPSPCLAGSIDDYAPTFDVTDTLVVKVDAEAEAVGAALERLDLTASVTAALSAFGGVDRVALAPALLAAQPGPKLVFGLVSRYEGPTETVEPASVQTFDTPGHVKVIWDLSVQPDALEGAWLSMTRRFAATDEATRARLLDVWGIIGPVANSLARRIVAAVKAYAEDWHEPPARGQWTLRRIDAAPPRCAKRPIRTRLGHNAGSLALSPANRLQA